VNKSTINKLLSDNSNRQDAFTINPKIWQLLVFFTLYISVHSRSRQY